MTFHSQGPTFYTNVLFDKRWKRKLQQQYVRENPLFSLNNHHKKKYEGLWAFMFIVNSVFRIANAYHWVAAMSMGQYQEAYHEDLLSAYKSLGQVSTAALFEQSGGLNAEHP